MKIELDPESFINFLIFNCCFSIPKKTKIKAKEKSATQKKENKFKTEGTFFASTLKIEGFAVHVTFFAVPKSIAKHYNEKLF